jgi:hypothetical protein
MAAAAEVMSEMRKPFFKELTDEWSEEKVLAVLLSVTL